MDKIIARMRGGLGNQLFILAFAYCVAESNNSQAEIKLDIREYKKYKIRNFELLEMLNDSLVSVMEEKEVSLLYEFGMKIFHVAQRLNRNDTNSIKYLSKIGLYFARRSPSCICESKVKKAYIYGYFQTAEVANRAKDRIKKSLKKQEILVDGYDANKYSIAISIRWGEDYVKQGWPICSAEYYRKGIDYILSKRNLTRDDVQVLVFSDEIEKVRDESIFDGAIYIQEKNPSRQLAIMMSCDDYVIANSSFSWWGAFLGNNEDKIVVMPEYWYADGQPTATTKLLYENVEIIK